jgi:tRNA (guanine-N7-)-methyltransferase
VRKKQKRFQDNFESPLVIEPGKPVFESIKGRWNEVQFKNDNPITLELACGRGEYSVGFGKIHKDRNYIGVDIKGARLWKGMKEAAEYELNNVAFLRTHIAQIGNFFDTGEVDEIWIIHPDPRPKKSDTHRRLTSPRYLNLYKAFLKEGSWVHLKTDNTPLFEYSVETLQSREDVNELTYTFDIYSSPMLKDHCGIQTRYEKEALEQGISIKYLKFRLG